MERAEYLDRIRRVAADIRAVAKNSKPALRIVGGEPIPPPPDGVALPMIDPSPRARAIRRISEIVNARGWQIEVTRTLDRHGASYVDDLAEDEVLALRERMERYEDNVDAGFELHETSGAE